MKKNNGSKRQDTYSRAMSHLMSRLLFTYTRKKIDFSSSKDGYWRMAVMQSVPEGALVVPFAIMDARQWWLGWYRGKNDEGYDLVESVETHEICKFDNTGFLFLDNLEFADNPLFKYTDDQYEMIDRIKLRVARNNYWYVVGNPVFHEDKSIDIPIRQKFKDEFYTKTYKNFNACTIAALNEHCLECGEMNRNKELTSKKTQNEQDINSLD